MTDRISIHTTHVGGDLLQLSSPAVFFLFQSTPPMWVVTKETEDGKILKKISIHTTRVGGDVFV